jgi:carotenoid cleavage dioxygenase-like enzyme
MVITSLWKVPVVTNRYLEGPFAPLHAEYTLTDLQVTGTVPDYLDGRYLRNGPNPIGEIDPELYHWFLGDGMVHGISSNTTFYAGVPNRARLAPIRWWASSFSTPRRLMRVRMTAY